MANLTAVTGNWTLSAGTNTAFGGVATTAADQITIPTGVTVTIVAANSVLGRNLTVAAGGTLVFAATTSVVSLGDGTAGTGNVALSIAATATITITGIGTINLVSTSATQQTINTGGKTIPNLNINGAGSSYLMGAALTSSGTITLSAGTFNTGNFALNAAVFNYGNATARTLTLGSSAVALTNASSPWTGSGIGSLTVTTNTSIVTCSGISSTSNFIGLSSKDWGGLSFVLTGGTGTNVASIVTSGATIKNLTITGTANQTNTYAMGGNITITGTFTVTGNSAVNRPTIQSTLIGTPRTITAATTSLTNVDFQDITAAGAAAWTGTTIGDRLGNSGITVTAPTVQLRDGTNGAAWSVAARWTSRVPLPQDDVVINASSGSISATDVLCLGKSINFTGYTGTLTHTTNTATYMYFGSITLGSAMNFGAAVTTFNINAQGRSSYVITSNGKTWFPTTSNNSHYVVAPGGTYTVADTYTSQNSKLTAASVLGTNAGTLDLNGQVINVGSINAATNTYVRAIACGAATVNLNSTASSMNLNATNLTFSGSSATFNMILSTGTARTWTGAGYSFGTVNYTVANSTGALTVSGSNTFGQLNIGSGRQLTLTASTTQIITNYSFSGSNYGYQYFMSTAANYVSVPDAATTSWTGDFDFRFKFAADAWNQSNMSISGKQTTTTTGLSWLVVFNAATKQPQLLTSANGTTNTTATSSAAVSFANGDDGWLRVTRRSSDGRVQFFTSTDSTNDPSAVSWVQLGTDRTATVGAIFDSPAAVFIGAQNNTTTPAFTGKFYRAQYRNNILDDGSGIQLDIDFTTKAFGADTFTESSSNAATATITGAAAQAGDGRAQIISATAGTQATLSIPSSGIQTVTYNKIKDLKFAQPYTFYPGTTSISVSNNTNVNFIDVPVAPYRKQGVSSTATSTSLTATLPIAATAGNLLVVYWTCATTPGTITGPAGFTQAATVGSATISRIYYKIATGGETTVTVSNTSSVVLTVLVQEIAGFNGTPTIDVSSTNTGSAIATLATTATTGPTNAMPAWAAVIYGLSSTGGASGTWTNSYQEEYTSAATTLYAASRPLTDAAAQSTTHTWTTARNASAALVTFKDLVTSNGNFFQFFN